MQPDFEELLQIIRLLAQKAELDFVRVKELLGQSSIETTMGYVHYVETFATKTVAAAQRKEQAEWLSSETETGYKMDTSEAAR